MNTYQNQLRADIERIDAERPAMAATEEAGLRYAERSGRFGALAHYYAGCADFEAAQRQRLSRDPKALIAAFTSQIAGPSAEDIAILLEELHVYLRLRPELVDADEHVEESAIQMRVLAIAEERRYAEDLDAPAAARSDDEYSRKVDDGMIGRSKLNPEVAA